MMIGLRLWLPFRLICFSLDVTERIIGSVRKVFLKAQGRVMREQEKILRAPNIANIEQYIDRIDEMIERKREAFAAKAEMLKQV